MKRFFSIIAILLVACLVPFGFMGCEGSKTASQVADAYSKLQGNYLEYFDTSTRAFEVEFTSSSIVSSMNVQSSKIYSLGKVYLPMIKSSMAFVNSQAKKFKDCLEKFSKDEVNEVYAGLKDFEEAFAEFAPAKKSFESKGNATGTGYSQFIPPMQNLINAAQRFNLAFYNAYYKNIYAKERDYTKSGFNFNSSDMQVEAMGTKLYVAYILNNHYTKHYVWSTKNDIKTYLSKSELYLEECINILNNSAVSTYASSDEGTLKALRENHNTFLTELNRAIKSMSALPYKDIYQGNTAPEDLEQKLLDKYNYVENFMEARYLPIYNAASLLSA